VSPPRHTLRALAALLLAGCVSPAEPARDAGFDPPDGEPWVSVQMQIGARSHAYVEQEACFDLEHTASPDGRIRVAWGDGSVDELPWTARSACHTWSLPGPVLMGATLEARAQRAEAQQLVRVVFEPSALPPTASGTLAYEDGETPRLWVVEPDADLVSVLDALTLAPLARIPVGERPRSIALSRDGSWALVACEGDGTLHGIDRRSSDLFAWSFRSRGAHGVAADPRNELFWITLPAEGRLVALSMRGPGGGTTVVASLDVGPDPRAVAVRDDGTVVVTRWRSTETHATVVIVDGSDAWNARVVGEVVLPREEGRDSDTDNDGVLSFLSALAISPDGGRVLVPALKANVVAGLHRTGLPLTSQTTARAALAEVSLGGTGEPGRDTFRHRFDDLDAASTAVFSPLGDVVYVAMRGAEVVVAIDAFSFDSVGSIDDVGHAPEGLAISPDGRTLFVHASLSREVRAYDVSDLSREPAVLARGSTVDVEPLAPKILAGAIVFHSARDPRMSRTRYVACATCHLDGEGDNLTWDFTQRGEGLRNTIPLRGRAGLGHGPLHWSANFDEVQDFEHDIRGGQGGTGFLPDEVFHVGTRDTSLGDPKAGLSPELDALAAYVTSLEGFGTSPLRRAGGAAWRAAYERGEALFRDPEVGCAECHAGPRYTDSAWLAPGAPRLHDVGTLGPGSGQRLRGALTGLDTPTLRGLWSSAPYLHDGSAPTLRAVLRERNPGDRHGRTSGLTDAELGDLEAFLRSLDDDAP
jgi:YVTN family beta-propeller protein